MLKIWITIILFCGLAEAIKPVDYVQVDRYIGRWYQQARNPRPFVEPPGCACAQQTITPNDKGYFDIHNSCNFLNEKGPRAEVRGKAYSEDPNSNSRFTVDFGDDDPSKYWIIAIGPEYEWSVVSDPEEKTLYILSKTPVLEEEKYQQAVQAAATQISTENLKRTSHKKCRYP
jgi:apolipoprotein D and lipocalin family protein